MRNLLAFPRKYKELGKPAINPRTPLNEMDEIPFFYSKTCQNGLGTLLITKTSPIQPAVESTEPVREKY